MSTTNVPVAQAGPLVRDVMLTGPDTLPPTATVADARARFQSPRHKLLLLADGDRYVGAVTRDSLDGADDEAALGSLAMAGVVTLAPEDAKERAVALGVARTPVVDADGRLAGLVCFNRGAETFCVAAQPS